ncbi:MAG: hypothetical protein ACFFDH_00430 [Promethearchaeota archaeon]
MQVAEVFLDMIFRDNQNVREQLTRISAAVDRARDRVATLGTNMQLFGQNMANFGSTLFNNVTVPIVRGFKDSIMSASDLNEAFNVVDTTFKTSSKEVRDWSKTLLEKFGLIEIQAINYAGSMGAMLKSSGLSEKASKDMAKSLVELNGDFASFYNLSHEETWEKIRAGISGRFLPHLIEISS